MSASSRGIRLAKRLRRQHKLQRDRVDALPWPHPRPASDERIVASNIMFIYVAIIQVVVGPPNVSVQTMAFGQLATVCFSGLMIFSSVLVLYAAFCKSQYNSFGVEMAGTVGFTGVFLIYTFGAIVGVADWYTTNVFAFASAQAVGNGLRAAKLIRRLW